METLTAVKDAGVKTGLLDNSNDPLPLVVRPEDKSNRAHELLTNWINSDRPTFEKKLIEHGAVLFKGFDIPDPQSFEDVALAIDPDLKNNYLGTSPRNLVTKYVFSASELPAYYPIMQHCEMSFLENRPRKLFFYCNVQPETGGETPICDFRKVYRDMDPQIRETFIKKGIRNVRNYNGPSTKTRFDMWKLKRWDEMFLTTDKAEVEKSCKENELDFVWKDEDKLALINEQPATIKHPVTGEDVWFNHLQVFHRDAAVIEYEKIRERQGDLRSLGVKSLLQFLTFLKKSTADPEKLAMHVTYKDGSEIPTAHVQHVQDVIWKHMRFFKWEKGDMIAIDNYSTSHGRMPYSGDRDVLVCWST